MAYTKYSLTPANNTATPPDGAPEGMLPSAVNDTMRDMMAQIRDCGDGIRDGTYTMTAPKITGGTITGAAFTGNTFTSPVISGGSINNTPIGASTANTGAFTTLSASGATTFSGATVVSGSLTANTFSSSGATITGGSINSTAIGGSTAAAGAFTTLSASGAFSANGGATLGDASGDALTINSSAVSIPNGLNFDSNTLVIDAANNKVGIGTASPTYQLDVNWNAGSLQRGRFVNISNSATAGAMFQLENDAGNTLQLLQYSSTYTNANEAIIQQNTGGQLNIKTLGAFPILLGTNNTERMRIDSSGNVGIGTSSPSQTLDIRGSTTVGTKIFGIGTNSNAITLVVNSAGNLAGSYNANTAPVQGVLCLGAFTSGDTAYSLVTRGGAILADTVGNVGIGTSSPAAKLEISGSGNNIISITSSSNGEGTLYLGAVGTGVKGNIVAREILTFHTTTSATPVATGTERMRIDSAGRVLVGLTSANTSGANFQVSSGVTFPATQSASSDANTLDDYEEGTWTPVIEGTTTAGTASHSSQNGRYTKIGRMVYIELYVAYSSGTGTGNLRIGGLPFTSAGSGTYPSLSIGFWDSITVPSGSVPVAYVDNSSTKIRLPTFTTSGGVAGEVTYDAAGAVQIAGCYTV